MTIAMTRAAIEMEQRIDTVTPHEVIALLMNGAQERIEHARQSLSAGDMEQAGELISKLVGIINGLRGSLDFDVGGELAQNLDKVYHYLLERLCAVDEDSAMAALDETEQLLGELKNGWDGIAE